MIHDIISAAVTYLETHNRYLSIYLCITITSYLFASFSIIYCNRKPQSFHEIMLSRQQREIDALQHLRQHVYEEDSDPINKIDEDRDGELIKLLTNDNNKNNNNNKNKNNEYNVEINSNSNIVATILDNGKEYQQESTSNDPHPPKIISNSIGIYLSIFSIMINSISLFIYLFIYLSLYLKVKNGYQNS
jgi:hypothetical protein